MDKHLIVNADDFGASPGINRAIVDCHRHGILTSASLMVTGQAAAEAVEAGRAYPDLTIGLHWDVTGEGDRVFDLNDVAAVRDEFERQLHAFQRLLGRMPTHVDSHQHVHWAEHLMPLFGEMVEPLGVPLRGDGSVRYVGGFYGQWEWMVTDLEHVRVPFLQWMLREEVLDGWTEISCHPGYDSPQFTSIYNHERETEVKTLCDSQILRSVEELGIQLANYADYQATPRARQGVSGGIEP